MFQRHKRLIVIIAILVFVIIISLLWGRKSMAPANSQTNQQTTQNHTSNDSHSVAPDSFNKKMYSIDDPTSQWVVVNKQRALPTGYAPSYLVSPVVPLSGAKGSENMLVSGTMSDSLKRLVDGAKQAGYNLTLVSGYRSYNTQIAVYGREVKNGGVAGADRVSARPGHSEHQTGFAADLGATSGKCTLDACFGTTLEGQWLAAHAHDYGFIIRYPLGKQPIVGYAYEPWHVRFVGTELSNELFKTGQTMEEFFGLPAAPDYN